MLCFNQHATDTFIIMPSYACTLHTYTYYPNNCLPSQFTPILICTTVLVGWLWLTWGLLAIWCLQGLWDPWDLPLVVFIWLFLCYRPIQELCLCWLLSLELSSTVPASGITIPLHLRKRLKTFQFAGKFTDVVWERCWFEWHYIIIWLHYTTLNPSPFLFVCSTSIWNPFVSYSFMCRWIRSGAPLNHWAVYYKCLITITIICKYINTHYIMTKETIDNNNWSILLPSDSSIVRLCHSICAWYLMALLLTIAGNVLQVQVYH